MERKVRMHPAGTEDIEAMLPREESRSVLLRHILKLKYWRSGEHDVADLSVTWDDNGFWLLHIEDQFGFTCGMVVEFYEKEIHGQIWVVGVRRANDEISKRQLSTVAARISVVDEVVDQQL